MPDASAGISPNAWFTWTARYVVFGSFSTMSPSWWYSGFGLSPSNSMFPLSRPAATTFVGRRPRTFGAPTSSSSKNRSVSTLP